MIHFVAGCPRPVAPGQHRNDTGKYAARWSWEVVGACEDFAVQLVAGNGFVKIKDRPGDGRPGGQFDFVEAIGFRSP